MRVLTALILVTTLAGLIVFTPAIASDVDDLLATGDWLHGPPQPELPPEPLYAYA